MTDARRKLLVATFIALSSFAMAADSGSNITVSGWVIDSACAYTKGLDKPIGPACAKACARNGSPLVILRDDGTIFLPIDDKTPSSSQNSRLMSFAGERVTVTGKDYVRNGSHGLVIDKISK
jgi:type 1 fimbria pilin